MTREQAKDEATRLFQARELNSSEDIEGNIDTLIDRIYDSFQTTGDHTQEDRLARAYHQAFRDELTWMAHEKWKQLSPNTIAIEYDPDVDGGVVADAGLVGDQTPTTDRFYAARLTDGKPWIPPDANVTTEERDEVQTHESPEELSGVARMGREEGEDAQPSEVSSVREVGDMGAEDANVTTAGDVEMAMKCIERNLNFIALRLGQDRWVFPKDIVNIVRSRISELEDQVKRAALAKTGGGKNE